jgi:hypothetical protein
VLFAFNEGKALITQFIVAVVLLLAVAHAGFAQVCSHPQDPSFYEANNYTVGKIAFYSPFSFFVLVRQRYYLLKASLPIAEGDKFSKEAYDQSFKEVDKAAKEDSVFGENSPFKIVVTTGGLENCHEQDDAAKTIDVAYRIFSTDPLPAIRATPETRQGAIEKAATTVAEQNTIPGFKIQPLLGYDHTNRGVGGGDLELRIPGKIVNNFQLSGAGSSTTLRLDAELNGSRTPHLLALDTLDYHVGYHYIESPAPDLRLAEGSAHARFTGSSKPLETASARTLVRYGASVEQGLQQSNSPTINVPADTIANSLYGAVRLYCGVTNTKRYSETAVSYGLEVGGSGLSSLSFTKQIGDVTYSLRLPGGTHLPWDIQARFSSGGITGSSILLNERFFGGNAVSTFIPGDSWRIPNGPLVRSIAANLLVADGVGGTAFYSTNLTVGKILKSSPMIPTSIETAAGFASGVDAAEDTAQGFFADGYKSAAPEYQALFAESMEKLKADIDNLQNVFTQIRSAGNVDQELEKTLKEAERQAHLAGNFIRDASVKDKDGLFKDVNKLQTVYIPGSSRFMQLIKTIPTLALLVSASVRSELENEQTTLDKDIKDIKAAIDTINSGPVGKNAEMRAAKDMVRPREIVDSLRHEANRFAYGVFGIFDTGRVWPDPYGTHYGIGGGVRFSLVNINLNLGYAVNPHPHEVVGQGRGALMVTLTYTNLFR